MDGDERRWRWWVLGALLLGFIAGFALLRSGTRDRLDNPAVERMHKPFPKGDNVLDVPAYGRIERGRRLTPQPEIDRTQGK